MPNQLTSDDLRGMSPEEVTEARIAGKLDDLDAAKRVPQTSPASLDDAIGKHYDRERQEQQAPRADDYGMASRVRDLADKADADATVLDILPPTLKAEVERFRAYRNLRGAITKPEAT